MKGSFWYKALFFYKITLVVFFGTCIGQQIHIKLIDSISQEPISLANFSLFINGKAVSFGTTKSDGLVSIISKDTGIFKFTFRHVNFSVTEHQFYKTKILDNYSSIVFMLPGNAELPNVNVVANIEQGSNQDTLTFDANAFKSIQTRKVSDLLSNIRGVSVEPDGRILFKGREVEALLINDDDVAQNEYGLLTKNLDAAIVSKIHVYDNYHKNRLMGKTSKSGKLAVNLELKSNIEGKLSGSAMVGVGTKERYEVDGNLVWLKGKLKVIELLNLNNTSFSKRGEGFGDNGLVSPAGNSNVKDEQPFKYQYQVSAAEPALPPLDNPYTFFNKDAVSKTFLHQKIGRDVKASLNVGLMHLTERNSVNAFTSAIIDSLSNWEILNTIENSRVQRVIEANANISHDRKKKLAGNLLIKLRFKDDFFSMEELAAIAILDSLNENVSSNLKGLKLSYTGAWQPGKKQVYYWQLGYSNVPVLTALQNSSTRWGNYWQAGNEIAGLEQITSIGTKEGYAETGTMVPVKAMQYNTKVRVDWGKVGGNTQMIFTGRNGGPLARNDLLRTMNMPQNIVATFRNNLQGAFFKKRLISELDVNPGMVKFNQILDEAAGNFFFIGDFQLKNKYKIAKRHTLLFDTYFNRLYPTHKLFFADSLVQGHVMVQQQTLNFTPFTDVGGKAAIQKFMPATNANLEVSFIYSRKTNDYRIAPIFNPNVNQWNWAPMGHNTLFGSTLQGKTYIFPLKFTLSGQVQFTTSEAARVVNQKNVTEVSNQIFSLINVVTNFKKKYNFELQYNFLYYSGIQEVNNEELNAHFSQNKVLLKAKWNINDFFYVGSQYQYTQIEVSGFHAMELYSTYVFTKRFSVDFRIHNLFGGKIFNYVANNPNFRSIQGFSVVPRFGLLKFYYSF